MDKIKKNIIGIYHSLVKHYGQEMWWPVRGSDLCNSDLNGEFKDLYRFEIIMGAILTQNTNWNGVDKALNNLVRFTDFNPYNIIKFIDNDPDLFKSQIKPTGYFNQKTIYLKNIAEFYISLEGEIPTRKELLSVKGVGNETADSILLYAYDQKEFVVDAYTKRIFSYLGYIEYNATYIQVKKFFQNNFNGSVEDYKTYHGVIVDHGKNYYRHKPYGEKDLILDNFKI